MPLHKGCILVLTHAEYLRALKRGKPQRLREAHEKRRYGDPDSGNEEGLAEILGEQEAKLFLKVSAYERLHEPRNPHRCCLHGHDGAYTTGNRPNGAPHSSHDTQLAARAMLANAPGRSRRPLDAGRH